MLKNAKVIAASIASLVFLALWAFGSYFIGSDAFLAGLICLLVGLSSPIIFILLQHPAK